MLTQEIGTLNSEGFFPYKAVDEELFLGGDYYGDIRLSRRLESLKSRIFNHQSLVIQQIADNLAEREAWYRLLKHPKMSISKMLSQMISKTAAWHSSSHILLVEDTSLLNYNHLKEKLKEAQGLGPTYSYNSRYFGYLMHLTLAIDAESAFPVAVADAQLWHKSEEVETFNKRKGDSLPIEKKSSYRWIDAALASANKIASSIRKTVVADREADIYQAICEWKKAGLDFIVRSQHDRNIKQSPGKLNAFVAQMPCKGVYDLELKTDLRSGKGGGIARMELRFGELELKRSHKAEATQIKSYPELMPLYVLSAKEVGQSKDALNWTLLTSHEIESEQDALQIIHWYKQRWHIEQLFRLLKNQGLQLENLQYQYGLNVLKMGVIAIETAFRILQLDLGIKTEKPLSIKPFFSSTQIQVLKLLCLKYEGKTAKSKNPYTQDQFQWAGWIIARVGGWKGYNSQARPGPITFARGWRKFNEISIGVNLLNYEIDM